VSEDRLWEEPAQVKFRPSYSTTTLFCPGSLLPSLATPDSSGWAAAEGTLFHRVIAEWQLSGERPVWLAGQPFVIDGHAVAVDEEMFVHAEACLERYADIPGQPQIEVRVDISSLTPIPGQSGTADRVHVYPGTVEIIDWKYGKGVQVFANWNTQLLCYAMGVVDKFGDEYAIERIRIHIAQPRLGHFDVWEISRDELELWAFWARAQGLHDIDAASGARWAEGVAREPNSPDFSFSVGGAAYFVVGLHPGASRAARRFCRPALIFNPHEQFERLRADGRYHTMQSIIREREIATRAEDDLRAQLRRAAMRQHHG